MTSAYISLYTVQHIKFQNLLRVQESEQVIAVLWSYGRISVLAVLPHELHGADANSRPPCK